VGLHFFRDRHRSRHTGRENSGSSSMLSRRPTARWRAASAAPALGPCHFGAGLTELMGGAQSGSKAKSAAAAFSTSRRASHARAENASRRGRPRAHRSRGACRCWSRTTTRRNRTVLAEMLGNWHMTPMLADGGKAALARGAGWRPTPERGVFPLILLDSVMPRPRRVRGGAAHQAGPEAARRDHPHAPRRREQPGDLERCREDLDIAAFLRKPIRQVAPPGSDTDRASASSPTIRRSPRPAAEGKSGAASVILLAEDNEVNQDFCRERAREARASGGGGERRP